MIKNEQIKEKSALKTSAGKIRVISDRIDRVKSAKDIEVQKLINHFKKEFRKMMWKFEESVGCAHSPAVVLHLTLELEGNIEMHELSVCSEVNIPHNLIEYIHGCHINNPYPFLKWLAKKDNGFSFL